MANFSTRLKELRETRGMSQGELGKLLGTTRQSISNYETGKREPDHEMTEALADIFNVDLDYLLGKSDKTTVLSLKDQRFLNDQEKEILKPFNKLNKEGQDKSIGYTWDLVDSGKYEEYETVEVVGGAAAGSGFEYLDVITVQKHIKKKQRPSYDLIIPVEGDSMQPQIPDGSLAFVKINTYLDSGKIYVVDADGKVYIKKVYFEKDKVTLKSINPDYKDIIIENPENFRVIGEVVDWE